MFKHDLNKKNFKRRERFIAALAVVFIALQRKPLLKQVNMLIEIVVNVSENSEYYGLLVLMQPAVSAVFPIAALSTAC